MRSVWRVAVLLVPLVASGCLGSDSASPVAASSSPSGPPIQAGQDAPEPMPTEDTGALSVTVVTPEVEPIGAASVTIQGLSLRAHTDSVGRATFNGLQPGSYTVLAAKPGYRTVQERGRIAEIRAAEITEVRLMLDPLALVSAETSYHRSYPFRGHIACGVEARAPAGVPQSWPCGRGLTYQGTNVGRDANDNTTHPFVLDNVQVQGWWLEAEWKPTQATLGTKLLFRVGRGLTCNGLNCNWERLVSESISEPPLRTLRLEGPQKNITKFFGSEPTNYPQNLITDVRVTCGTAPPCAAAMLQQTYTAYMSLFYGKDPPADFTLLPKQ